MSAQVGSGHIAIFPVMKGFKSRVSRDVKSAGKTATSEFSSSMKGAGRTAGERLGRDLKSAVDASASGVGAGALKGMNREVATASAALSKARLKQQDEAGKVRVAEVRLQEAIDKSGAGSARAVAAEERLAAARRSHKSAVDSVTAATTRLKGAQEAVRQAASTGATASRWGDIGQSAAAGMRSLVEKARDIGARAGQALGNALKGAATVSVTAASAVLGVALGAGFSRLNAIDSARAKLTGLGNDGQTVAAIMGNATASVKGTAFGLGEAANVAAAAVAAQIKPGKELESHLKRVANNASAAGMSMEDMGAIFNKAATQANGVQNDVIGQLADKGIPIYAELGKQMGVTAGEVFKLASEGKVDFETFSKAAEAAAGTVADEMGKTVPGAFKNLKASLGRIGANLFGGIDESGEMFGVYAKIGPLIASVTSALGPFEERAKGIGSTLDKTVGPAMEWLTKLFEQLGSGSGDIVDKLKGMAPVLAPIGAAFVALGAGGLAGMIKNSRILAPLLGGLAGPLGLLGGPLGIAAAAITAFIASGSDASGLIDGVTGIVDSIVGALPGLIDQVVAFIPKLVTSLSFQIPRLVKAAVGIVGALVDGIVTAVPMLVDGAVSLVDGLLTAIIGALPMIIDGAVELVTALVQGLVQAVPALGTGAVQLVVGLVRGIVQALPLLIDGAIQLVTSLLTAIIENLPLLIDGAVQMVTALVGGLIEALPLLIDGTIQLVMGLLTAIVANLPLIIQGGIELILALLAGILEMLPELIVAGIDLVVALITGLIEAIPQIIEMLPQIVSAIWDGLANVDWLGLGAQIIQGVIDGFFSMVGAVGDAVGSIVQTITDFFPHSPAKRGPLSGAGWYRLKDSGGAMIGQFNDGALAGASEFEETMAAMAQSATQKAQAVMGRASATVSVASDAPSGSVGGKSFQQINNFAHEDPEVAAEIAARKFENALGGV